MLYVARKTGLPRKFARFVLFRPIKKRSFNLLCVWGLPSQLTTELFQINVQQIVPACGLEMAATTKSVPKDMTQNQLN